MKAVDRQGLGERIYKGAIRLPPGCPLCFFTLIPNLASSLKDQWREIGATLLTSWVGVGCGEPEDFQEPRPGDFRICLCTGWLAPNSHERLREGLIIRPLMLTCFIRVKLI